MTVNSRILAAVLSLVFVAPASSAQSISFGRRRAMRLAPVATSGSWGW